MWFRCAITFGFLLLVITAKKHHHHLIGKDKEKSDNVRRFTISNNEQSTAPVLEDEMSPERITIVRNLGKIKDSELPGALGADQSLTDVFDTSSGSGDSDTQTQRKFVKHRAETAANFGSHIEPKVGINPSSAFMVMEGNHDGFKGDDKVVNEINVKTHKRHRKKYRKQHNISKTNSNDKKPSKQLKSDDNLDSDHQADTDIISQIQDIAKQIDAVEKKREEEKKVEDKKIKNDKKKEGKKKKIQNNEYVNNDKEAKKQVSIVIDKIQKDVEKYQAEKEDSTKQPEIEKSETDTGKMKTVKSSEKNKTTTKSHHGKKKSEDIATVNTTKSNNSYLSLTEVKGKNVGHDKTSIKGAIKSEKDDDKDLQSVKETKDNAISVYEGSAKTNAVSLSPQYPHGEAGGPEGFECPWVCFWTCHSYCPKECCNNPFKCNSICRTFCTPYCSDRCCAPGSRRLPHLALNFQKTAAETGNLEGNQSQIFQSNQKIQQVKSQLASQYEAIKQASAYATRYLGLPQTCPLFCTRVCAPGLCRSDCCSRSLVFSAAELPHYPQVPLSAAASPLLPQTLPAGFSSLLGPTASSQVPASSPKQMFCPTPINCPQGGKVDPDYCPPICRSSCIEQCPNECCPNYGRPAIQPKH